MPLLEHATGEQQDLSEFADLEGNLPLLAGLLLLTWTIAAFGEEVAYRGFTFTRLHEAVGPHGVSIAVLGSSVLFGLAHTEQGPVGVAITFCDALFFAVLRLHYATLWAPILAHGFSNTLGLTAFYLVGPIHGLW